MKVILTERVKSLGNVGDIVNVSPGYGRNFLLPKKYAVLADEANKARIDHLQKSLAKKVEEQKSGAVAVQGKLNGHKVNLERRVAASGKLFGAVTALELAKILSDEGFDVEKRHLLIANPIKALGTFEVKAKLFSGVEATFEVNVAQDQKQVEENAKKEAEKKEFEAQQAKEKAEKEAKAAEAGEDGEAPAESVEMTEEQRLKAEAMKILRN
jgi:large subunit ribosomal protein L9